MANVVIEDNTSNKGKDAYNIGLLDVNKFIIDNNVGEVTSQFIRIPSSTILDPKGLFSQEIFGEIGSSERMMNFGYINLKTRIYHPRVYKTLITLKGLYGEILAGKAFAYFDEEKKDFEKTSRDNDNGGTGYSFFINRYDDIEFTQTKSLERVDKIKLIKEHRELAFLSKYIISVAGLRDIEIGDVDSYDDINKLYLSLISLSQALPPKNSENPVYDTVRYAIQRKANEIFDYINNFMKDKHGWLQDKFSKRAFTLGARNVISAAKIIGMSPKDPSLLKSNECMMGTFQTIKTMQPIAVYYLKRLFFDQVVKDRMVRIPVIDQQTKKLTYADISSKVKDKLISSEGIGATIKRFEDTNFRSNTVSIEDVNGKFWDLFLVYDDGNQISIFRDIDGFELYRKGNIDRKYIRALTYIEMFYIVAVTIARGKHGICTRYPVTNDDNVLTPKIKVASTKPDRLVKMTAVFDESMGSILPHYPIIGNGYIDSMIVHPSTLNGLGADYDGDALNGSAILSNQANAEVDNFLNSLNGIIKPDRTLRYPHNTHTLSGIYALSRPFLPHEIAKLQPPEKK